MRKKEEWEVQVEAGEGSGWGPGTEILALSHTATLEWMGCSDGCLNRLIGLASREIGTDGKMDRMREERKREQKSDKGRATELREMGTEGGMKRWMVRDEYGC